jgi:hypothetical protein
VVVIGAQRHVRLSRDAIAGLMVWRSKCCPTCGRSFPALTGQPRSHQLPSLCRNNLHQPQGSGGWQEIVKSIIATASGGVKLKILGGFEFRPGKQGADSAYELIVARSLFLARLWIELRARGFERLLMDSRVAARSIS